MITKNIKLAQILNYTKAEKLKIYRDSVVTSGLFNNVVNDLSSDYVYLTNPTFDKNPELLKFRETEDDKYIILADYILSILELSKGYGSKYVTFTINNFEVTDVKIGYNY